MLGHGFQLAGRAPPTTPSGKEAPDRQLYRPGVTWYLVEGVLRRVYRIEQGVARSMQVHASRHVSEEDVEVPAPVDREGRSPPSL